MKKGAEELKKEVKSASKETIEMLKIRAKEAMAAMQIAIDKVSGEVNETVEVEAKPESVNGEEVE